MSRLFEDATERRARGGDNDDFESVDWYPASDVSDTESAYLIAVDLPGVERSALEIDLDDKNLVIRGAREIEKRGDNSKASSRPHGRFRKSFSVPANVAQDGIQAEYRNGVLEVRLPKRSEPSAKRIQIKVD
ncbi:MAG TPA: Hsp20/alpha crystallin family protein [Pyrinomonadaceae bacterium]|nr:Hsp20/alpha crystallin family protein [Pyrinomonadaceae bacterium]